MIDTLYLILEDTLLNQSYQWDLDENLVYVSGNPHKTVIQVKTNGIAGTYPVSAYGVGSGECSASSLVNSSIIVNTPLFTIASDLERTKRSFYLDPWDLEDIESYDWFIDNEFVSHDTEISVPRSTVSAFVEVIVTFVNGCRQYDSYTLGAQQSNFNNLGRKKQTRRTEYSNSMEGDISIIPNPANSEIVVSLPIENDESLVRILDASGRVVYRNVTYHQTNRIDTSLLPEGMYILVASIKGERKTKQFLIKH